MPQFTALTGRKLPSTQLDQTRARAELLPAKVRADEAKDYNERSLSLSKELGERELSLMDEANKQQARNRKMSTAIGLGNLGLQAYMGTRENDALASTLDGGGDAPAEAFSYNWTEYDMPSSDGTGFSQLGDAFTDKGNLLNYGLGAITGNALGRNTVEKAAIGGATSGLTNWIREGNLSKLLQSGEFDGGDIYDNVANIVGGAGAAAAADWISDLF